MVKITREQIVHVAKLARLHLDDAAVELYTKQLGDILTYMDTLKSNPPSPWSVR
jgi:aspartyl-tRNA(Asn)/glutamyl-tRNA(Gln) amidotransferase subunit C